MKQTLEYACGRIEGFIEELERLEEIEFPYAHSKNGLDQLKQLFERKLLRLRGFSSKSNPGIVKQECSLALESLFNYLPLAGFILRSTNVRNAFEVYRPLLRLAADVLESTIPADQRQTKLILSSEWDYSPLTYPDVPELPHFVLIGIPAPESSNPLLVPLAGHELGHSLCAKHRLPDTWRPQAKAAVIAEILNRWSEYQTKFPVNIKQTEVTTNLFAVETWTPAVEWCLKQAEETFCDFVGIRIFGTSYFHAFAYLLSPSLGARSVLYPSMQVRVANMEWVAREYKVSAPKDYNSAFDDDVFPTLLESDKFRAEIADKALQQLTKQLASDANRLLDQAHVGLPKDSECTRIYDCFKRAVPAENCQTLSELVDAAWKAELDPDFWRDFPVLAKNRGRILKELVLKNFEVFDIEYILKST